MKQSELSQKLINISEQLNSEAANLINLPLEQLTKRPKADAWNALECFEHLNLYIDIYNDFFEEALSKAKSQKVDQEIKRGYWGNKFIEMMEPKEKGTFKMNTFKSKNPMGAALSKEVIKHFINSNEKTVAYLKAAEGKNIQQVKSRLALPLLKLKLSDAFHFLVAHNQRHMVQIKSAVS